jgi:hypothetical protein
MPKIRMHRPTSLGHSPPRRDTSSPQASPRHRNVGLTTLSPVDYLSSPEIMTTPTSAQSPLARLFGSRFPSANAELPGTPSTETAAAQASFQASANTEASVKHIATLLEAVGQLPVHKLKEEMKELQDRQARIENLLLMLTRGMRNETPHHQNTMP